MPRERLCRCGKPLQQSQTEDGRPGRWPKYCSDGCRQAAYREESPTTVYRLYDAEDRLLYVGCSNGVKARFKTHAATKDWWTEVERVELEHYPNRNQALSAESEAIREEKPLHNGQVPIDVDSSPPGIRMVRIMIQLDEDLLQQVDEARGAVPRAAWVRLLIEDRLGRVVAKPGSILYGHTVLLGEERCDCDLCGPLLAGRIVNIQASVAQPGSEQRSPKPQAAGSNPARRAVRGSPDSSVPVEAQRSKGDAVKAESPSPIRCVCGGVILGEGSRAGKCTKCAKPRRVE